MNIRRKKEKVKLNHIDLFDWNDGSEEAFDKIIDWLDAYDELLSKFDRT
jgi:hypothetical protein